MFDSVARAFPDFAIVQINSGHARLCRKRDKRGARACRSNDSTTARRLLGGDVLRGQFPTAETVLLFRQYDDGTALWGFVGQRRELGRVCQLRFADAGQRQELCSLSVTERDGASLVQE